MILVLGSSNVVSRTLTGTLLQSGESVRLGWHSREPQEFVCETARINVVTGEGLGAAMKGVKSIFLLTGGIDDQSAGEARVIDTALQSGAKRVVYLSILGADSEAFPFARWHRATERKIETSGLEWVCLRPGGFMQNFTTHYLDSIRYTGEIALPCGDTKEPHIDARDIARIAKVSLLEDRLLGRMIDLTGPEPISYHDAARLISKAAGREVKYRPVSEADFSSMLAEFAAPQHYAGALISMFQYHASLPRPIVTDSYREIIGYPPIEFSDFVQEHSHNWREVAG